MQPLKTFKPYTKENLLRLCVYLALELFLVVSLVYFTVAYFMGKAVITQAIMCVFGIVAVSIADIMQGLCKFRIATPVYFFILAYSVCPTLGHTYGLYYYISWWDKLLHMTGGVVFALACRAVFVHAFHMPMPGIPAARRAARRFGSSSAGTSGRWMAGARGILR